MREGTKVLLHSAESHYLLVHSFHSYPESLPHPGQEHTLFQDFFRISLIECFCPHCTYEETEALRGKKELPWFKRKSKLLPQFCPHFPQMSSMFIVTGKDPDAGKD